MNTHAHTRRVGRRARGRWACIGLHGKIEGQGSTPSMDLPKNLYTIFSTLYPHTSTPPPPHPPLTTLPPLTPPRHRPSPAVARFAAAKFLFFREISIKVEFAKSTSDNSLAKSIFIDRLQTTTVSRNRKKSIDWKSISEFERISISRRLFTKF